jgi:hypothetical protein
MTLKLGSPPERTIRSPVTMKPTSGGGIKQGFHCPVVSFFHRTPEATLWVAIAPVEGRLVLSQGEADVVAELAFFRLDQDISHVVPGSEFDVWYVDPVVGRGQIL